MEEIKPPSSDVEEETPAITNNTATETANDNPDADIVMQVIDSENIGTIAGGETRPGAVAVLGPGIFIDNVVAALTGPPSNPGVLNAPVVNDPTPLLEATAVPPDEENPTVYDAVQIEERPLYRKKGFVYGGGGLLVGAALAVGLSLGLAPSRRNSNDSASDNTTPLPLVPSLSPTQSSQPTSTVYFKPIGGGINGKAELDLLGGGISFSKDGQLLAVSAGQLGNGGPGYISVHKFDEESSDYQLIEEITGEMGGDAYGYTLSISANAVNNTLIVGAPFAMNRTGFAYVYRWNDTSFTYDQMGKTLNGNDVGDTFGELVDVSEDGSIVAVGSTGSDVNGDNSGSVYLYKWDEAMLDYIRIATLHGEGPSDKFGYSLSLSSDGKTIAVGSPVAANVRVFEWNETAADYVQQGPSLSGDDGMVTELFGWAVALSGDGSVLAVGELLNLPVDPPLNDNDPEINTAGQVHLYNWDENSLQYEQFGSTLKGDKNKDDFGASIFLSDNGSTMVVGAPMYGIENTGQIKVFQWNESATDYVQLYDSIFGDSFSNYFGGPVSISGDGSVFAAGAVGNSDNGPFSGKVRAYEIPVE